MDGRRPYHYFERIDLGDDSLAVSGWALWPDGPADRLTFRSRRGLALAVEPVPRPDLAGAFAWIPAAERGGFRCTLPLAALDGDEVHSASLVGTRGGRELGAVTLRAHRTDHAAPTPHGPLMEAVALHRDPLFFVAEGMQSVNELLARVAAHRDLRQIRRWLDWGCGCGRQTRFLLERLPHAQGHGVDVDAAQIDWLHANLPRGHYRTAATLPPMDYPDGHFDLVVASSVFTHMRLRDQERWLADLKRVLAPGGLLAATVHGAAIAEMARLPAIDAALADVGAFDGLDRDEFAHHGPDSYFRATYQTAGHVRRLWNNHLDLVDFLPGAQNGIIDLWIGRRRA